MTCNDSRSTYILWRFAFTPGRRLEPPLGLERFRGAADAIFTPGVNGLDASEFVGEETSTAGEAVTKSPVVGAGDITGSSMLGAVVTSTSGVGSFGTAIDLIFNLTMSDGFFRPFVMTGDGDGEPKGELSEDEDIFFMLYCYAT